MRKVLLKKPKLCERRVEDLVYSAVYNSAIVFPLTNLWIRTFSLLHPPCYTYTHTHTYTPSGKEDLAPRFYEKKLHLAVRYHFLLRPSPRPFYYPGYFLRLDPPLLTPRLQTKSQRLILQLIHFVADCTHFQILILYFLPISSGLVFFLVHFKSTLMKR